MTPQEFKAWFDGFTEALTATPNKEQWKRIKARVAEIDGKAITERVYIDRYWPQRYYGSGYIGSPVYTGGVFSNSVGVGAAQCGSPSEQYQSAMHTQNAIATQSSFNGTAAMHALGFAESQEIN